jgi:hypothetical protein
VALPPERIMAALAPLSEPAPGLQPRQQHLPAVPLDKREGAEPAAGNSGE